MAIEDKEKLYATAGLGTGEKFRKRPFHRNQTTPYDRPPTSLRKPKRNNSWLSKLVDPAHRLITYSAHLFSSLFRKRLPPPPSEREQEARLNHHEEATFIDNSSGKQQGAVGEGDVQINCSNEGGLTELEKLLKQKTFSRSEIDHLTALLRSRTVDAHVREEEKKKEIDPSEPMLTCGQRIIPHVTSSVPIEDVASPVELAKAYMASRPSNLSSSKLGVQNPVPREDPTLLKSENFPLKSPIMSIAPNATRHVAVHENGFVTPRSRGRSAIYRMARTPYARIYPSSTLKGGGLAVEGEPSSSTRSALDHDMLSGPNKGILKRRSSALDNDVGSFSRIRRIRHKSNLLYSKGSSLPLYGSSLSVARSGVGIYAAQQPSSSMQKPILLDEVKRSHTKLSGENVDNTMPSMSYSPVPSKSSEMASKIAHQIDKLVSPKEKSSELRSCAKNLKELRTNNRRLKGDKQVSVSQNMSALIQPMPKKCQDPGTFTIPCIIGNSIFHDCVLDLGASINVMPESVYKSLSLGPLCATSIVVQLANRSSVHPSGVVEDILVRVNNLIFPADFYVLRMEGETPSSTIILGRPFMKTARTKIDVHAGTLSMEIGDSMVNFNISNAMKFPREEHSILATEAQFGQENGRNLSPI